MRSLQFCHLFSATYLQYIFGFWPPSSQSNEKFWKLFFFDLHVNSSVAVQLPNLMLSKFSSFGMTAKIEAVIRCNKRDLLPLEKQKKASIVESTTGLIAYLIQMSIKSKNSTQSFPWVGSSLCSEYLIWGFATMIKPESPCIRLIFFVMLRRVKWCKINANKLDESKVWDVAEYTYRQANRSWTSFFFLSSNINSG